MNARKPFLLIWGVGIIHRPVLIGIEIRHVVPKDRLKQDTALIDCHSMARRLHLAGQFGIVKLEFSVYPGGSRNKFGTAQRRHRVPNTDIFDLQDRHIAPVHIAAILLPPVLIPLAHTDL